MSYFERYCRDRLHLRANSELIYQRPDGLHKSYPVGSAHWKVTLFNSIGGKRRQLTCYYSQGPAVCSDPSDNPAEVLGCLLHDASCSDNSIDFADFCYQLGYKEHTEDEGYGRCINPVSWRIYTFCRQTADRLRRFLGSEYETTSEAIWDY